MLCTLYIRGRTDSRRPCASRLSELTTLNLDLYDSANAKKMSLSNFTSSIVHRMSIQKLNHNNFVAGAAQLPAVLASHARLREPTLVVIYFNLIMK